MSDLPPLQLGPMPTDRSMTVVDEQLVRAPVARIVAIASDVERWPTLLPHYRFVRFLERRSDGGGVVDMSANRPFGIVQWPTWWRSRMSVMPVRGDVPPSIRFTHIAGITSGMDVEWTFEPRGLDTHVRIVHVWNGPAVPAVGSLAASLVIGPVFVHGIASRTLAGLATHAERAGLGAGN